MTSVMTRVPLQTSPHAVFRPGDATDFFELAPALTDAALGAEMARVAYVPQPERLPHYLARAGFRLIRVLDNAGTQAFLAEGESPESGAVMVAAFRGTEVDDPRDLASDADLTFTAWPVGGRVHTGFARAFEPVRVDFLAATSADVPLLITGHSLGAGLATLAATHRPAARVFTFGSSRVGDAAFGTLPGAAAVLRYVNCCDLVARIPAEELGYAHAGRMRFIDAGGGVHEDWSSAQIDAERRRASLCYLEEAPFLRGGVVAREIADHAPVNYSSALLGVRG
jgi:triacylglycerol lipase